MLFPMIVYKSENSSYGGLLPDFPGCYPMAETLGALLQDDVVSQNRRPYSRGLVIVFSIL
jgi:hypothetical protein